jgi:arylsulfatase A-like enzyme
MPASAPPNIVLILADQLRRDALGCYGAADAATPRLDRLAREGIAFTAACSSFPVCVPYRFTLLTGLSAFTRDVPCRGWRLSPAERTLADEFNEAGYDTAWIGKWHLFGTDPPEPGWVPPDHRGRFGYWEGFEKINGHFETVLYSGDERRPQRHDGYQTDVLTDRALAWLGARAAPNEAKTKGGRKERGRARAARPFFLVLSVEPPHPPLEAPAAYQERRLAQPPALPPNFMHAATDTGPEPKMPAGQRAGAIRNRQIYQAMVDNLDDNVGRFLDGLSALGFAEDTVVVFTADHGQMDGAHALPNVVKRLPFEESIGVPLIVRDPRHPKNAGKRADEVVGSEDMFPTLLALAGIAPPAGLPGGDLTPLLADPGRRLDRPGLLLYLTHHLTGEHPWYQRAWRGIRTREHMFACWGPRATGLRPWLLYDTQDDPHQLRNLLASDRARAAQLAEQLRTMMAAGGDHLQLRL